MYMWDLVTVGTHIVVQGAVSPQGHQSPGVFFETMCRGDPSNRGGTDYAKLHHMLELLTSDMEALERLSHIMQIHAYTCKTDAYTTDAVLVSL